MIQRWTVQLMAVTTVLIAPGVGLARKSHEPGDGVPGSIRYYESVSMMSSATTAAAERGDAGDVESTALSFYTLGRQFDLTLEPTSPFAPGATVHWVDDSGEVVEPAGGGPYYRGGVDGDPSSWARITVRGEALAGMIVTGGEVYFLEPASRFFGEGTEAETLAYRLSDTDSEWEPGTCAAREPSARQRRRMERQRRAVRTLSDVVGTAAITATATQFHRAQLGMVADFEYFSRHGAASADNIAEIVNAVDGIYQSEIGVTLELVTTVVYTTSSDPFSSATNPNTILSEFTTWKNNNDDNSSEPLWGTDYAHLITGRDLDSNVIGIAFVAAVCSGSATGVDQDFSTALNTMTLLLAHEMGHNFGASHDAQSGSPCASAPSTFIMNPVISSSLQQKFSDCSKSYINPFVDGASCLDLVDATPPTPTPTPAPPTLNPLPSPIVVGGTLTLTGTGFTAGSVINLFVNINGPIAFGPYSPTSRTSTTLTFAPLDPTVPLGNGFASVQVINTDQNYVTSNEQSQYLFGQSTLNIPTITALNGHALRPLDVSVPLASVETALPQGSTLTITGTGFNTPLVNLYTSTGYVGPLTPLAGGSSTQIQVLVPANATTGPLAVQVVNYPYMGNVVSNSVSAALGAAVSLTSTTQNGSTVTVHGTGFSPMTVINLWAKQTSGGTGFFGGYSSPGHPRIPITLVSDTELRFTLPSGVASGMAYVQIVNPPFIPYSTSGSDPDGMFVVAFP